MIAKDVELGANVLIPRPELVNLYGCRIGAGTLIGPFVEIQKNSVIGRNCKISSHAFICEGVIIEREVFVGHNVTFVNDRWPRACDADGRLRGDGGWTLEPVRVRRGASIGSGAVIMAGVTIGERAMVGAGSVVTNDVPDNTVVAGNPAAIVRLVSDTE
jgi:acetyltransferase-like isoleucine patch superfamily enzyme